MLIFGLLGWPIAFNLLRHLPDSGLTVARSVGLLLTGYLLWIGGTFRLLQNDLSGIIIAMLMVLVIGLSWQWHAVRQGQPTMLGWLKREWRYVVGVELLFTLAFAGWVIFRSYNPNIETAGGEKWMEIAFINGVLRSDYFPPQDPWLSGFAISYYYFGYVLMAMVTQLTGIVSTTAFNLYIPTLFALTLTGALGIVANLVTLHQRRAHPSVEPAETDFDTSTNADFDKLSQRESIPARITLVAMLTGLAGALFVGFLGNLIGLFEVIHKRGLILSADFWQWLDIRDLKNPPIAPSDSWLPDRFIWWWRGSRVLTDYNLAGQEQEVIDEFPFFSFLLGDVHPHVLALPFVLLVIALALNLLHNRVTIMEEDEESEREPSSTFAKLGQYLSDIISDTIAATGGRLQFGLYALAIGSLGFLNTWDLPIYLSVIGFTLIAWQAQQRINWQMAVVPGLLGSIILAMVSVGLYFPFYATFQSQAGGILPNLWNPTRLPHLFVFFGTFLVAISGLLMGMSAQQTAWRTHLKWTLPLTLLGPIVVLLVVAGAVIVSPSGQQYFQGILNNPAVQQNIGGGEISDILNESWQRRLTTPGAFLLLGGLLGWAAALLVGFTQTRPKGFVKPFGSKVEQFVLILLLVGLLLPLTVEFIFLRDNFGYRMNTIFKFYFQAWVLMALAAAFALYYVSRTVRGGLLLGWHGAMLLLVLCGLIYPTLAMANKTNYFNNEPTLDGIAWIERQRPDDHAGVEWLRQNAPPEAVVLEAPGAGFRAYQYDGRVSALTGVPTLLGWGGHQHQWRGNYDEPGRREPDIERLFNTTDPQEAQRLLDAYNITHVYIGPLERQRYAPFGLEKFAYLMEPVFESGEVTIYQRR